MKFTVYRAPDGWRWRLVAKNGRIIATSHDAYVNRGHAVRMATKVATLRGCVVEVQ